MGTLLPKRTVGEIVWNGRRLKCIGRYDDLELVKPKPKIFAWKTRDLYTDGYVILILKLVKTYHEKDPTTCPWGSHMEHGKPCGAQMHLVEDRGPYMEWTEEDPNHVMVWIRKSFVCERGHKLPFAIAHEKYKIIDTL